MSSRAPLPAPWPPHGGDAATLLRTLDWDSLPLGPTAGWSTALKACVGMMLPAHVQIVLFWGPRFVALYNDVYAPTIGQKHPRAFGRPAEESWTELWDDLAPLLTHVRSTGETISARDRPFTLNRHGYLEEVFFDISYSAVLDDTGQAGGVLCIVNETTGRVRATRDRERSEAALKVAEQARLAEAERIQLALNAGAVVGTWVWDVQHDRFTADASFARKFLLDPKQLAAGVPIADVKQPIHPDDLPAVNARIAEVLVRGGSYRADYRVASGDGGWAWIEANGHVEHDDAGRPTRFPGVLIDIGQRRRAEAGQRQAETDLRTTNDQFRLAQAAAGFGVFSLDVATDILTVSHDFCRLFGLPLVSTVPAAVLEALHAPDEGSAMSDTAGRGAGASPLETEYRIRRADTGELVWLARRAEFVRDADGHVTAMRGVVQDVSKRRAADEALRAHQLELARVNALLEERVAQRTRDLDRVWRLSTDLMLISRLDGTIQSVNPAWHACLGWHPNDLAGRPFTDFLHPDDVAEGVAENDRLSAGQATARVENRWRHRDGSYRRVAWTAVPEGGFVHAVGRDITAEQLAGEALREAEERLRQSQKMEAVGQLTGGIAHDFNNLLQGISGSLEVVRKRIAQGRVAEVERYVTGAIGATQRAAALTHRLLAFSRRQPLDPKPVLANPLVGSMEDLLRRTLGEQVGLEMVLAGGLWATLCDPNQLENALLNLAINARDAMPEGGKLVIETHNALLDADYAAQAGTVRAGQYVCIAVTDSGTGMPPEVVERAFEPFFTTKPLGQGTGLGLSMIYGFALQSEGFCRIYSEVGQGTTVKLYLPRFRGAIPAEPVAPVDAGAAADHGEVVVVVEDEPVVRDLIVDMLTDLGYRVLSAADGPSGLALLQQTPRVDLLVTDIGLPGMNGRQLADTVRRDRPALKTIFMTGYAENAALAHGFLSPGMVMITKPFALASLAERVHDVLAGARH